MVTTCEIRTLAQKLRNWEMDAGESFVDYFMDGRVNEINWAFWLLGKGHTATATFIINSKADGVKYLDQTEKFHVHYNDDVSWDDWDAADAIYFKDFLIWAEFLLASKVYTDRINEWFSEQEQDEEEEV